MAIVLLIATVVVDTEDRRVAAVVATVAAGLSLGSLFAGHTRRAVTLGQAYTSLFIVFHFGLVLPLAVGHEPALYSVWDRLWFESTELVAAVQTATIALLSFVIAYHLVMGLAPRDGGQGVAPDPPAAGAPAERARVIAGRLGAALLAGGAVAWVLTSARSGASAGGSYLGFLEATSGGTLPFVYMGIGFGSALAASAPEARARRVGLVALLMFSIPAFGIGLRGEVILPAMTWLVVASRARPQTRLRWLVPAGVAALTAGSVVRQVRQGGVAEMRWSNLAASPLDGLGELGYTIRPLTYVQQWHGTGGEPVVGFGTYTAPVERLLLGRVLGLPVEATATDPRVFSATIAERVGPIGGSVAAEAQRAGGLIGVVVVLAVIGVTVALLDRSRRNSLQDAWVGVLTYALLLWIRNDFTPVPLELVIGASLVLGSRLLAVPYRRDRGRQVSQS